MTKQGRCSKSLLEDFIELRAFLTNIPDILIAHVCCDILEANGITPSHAAVWLIEYYTL